MWRVSPTETFSRFCPLGRSSDREFDTGRIFNFFNFGSKKSLFENPLKKKSEYENDFHRQFQRGRDTEFDRLLSALGRMSEYCLSSLIRHALDWRQLKIAEAEKSDHQRKKVEGRLSALNFCRNLVDFKISWSIFYKRTSYFFLENGDR